MRTSLKTMLTFATAFMVVTPVIAEADPTPGWYMSVGVGGNISPDETAKTKTGTATLQYDPSSSLQASSGYSWDNGFRSELELFHNQTNINTIKNGVGKGGHISNNDLFGNALYDISTGTNITPYVGAGLGFGLAEANDIGGLTNGTYLKSDIATFAYQAIAGMSAQLDRNWALTADYRYVATPDPKFHDTSGRGVYTGNQSHNIILGLRYSFDEPTASIPPLANAAPTSLAPAPVAAPAVAPVVQNYTVFFDFNKSNLTPEAKRIIAAAAHDYQKGHYIRIVVTGHTDTVGSAAYNQKLSESRATSIKAEFKKLGVDARQIRTTGVGKNDLLIPTSDGVREAQNRRGEIVFNKQ